MAHKYTKEQADFIKTNINGTKTDELTKMFNVQFGLSLKQSQIKSFVTNHGLKSGVDCRLKKGNVPFNKGKKGTYGWEPTQFKKGNKPHNYMPVGSERINGDGYIDVKIADPNKWRPKHLLIWEKINGAVPNGHVVIFGDGNKLNLDINNLILVSRRQLVTLNKKQLIKNDAELTKTGILIADLYHKISQAKSKTKAGGVQGVGSTKEQSGNG